MVPACNVSTQISQAAAPYMGKARTFFSPSIQAPGLGRRFLSPGANETRTKGDANPRPRAANTLSAAHSDCVRANAMALAMNGAVQGAATTTARAPVRAEPIRPPLVACPPAPCSERPAS